MTEHEDGSVTLTKAEWEDLNIIWDEMDHYFCSASWTFEDILTGRQCVAYHRTQCLMEGAEYRTEDYGDELLIEDLEDEEDE